MGKRTTVGAGIGLGVIMAVPATAQAEDIKVTNLNADGPGSLRQATEDASADTDADRILFKSKLSGTITLPSADDPLYILRGDLEIVGPGARKLTVDGGGETKVFGVYGYPGPIDAIISGLTITGGDGTGDADGRGGGVDVHDSDLTLSRVAVIGNTAEDIGGGVDNDDGTLTIDSSTISGNTAEGDNGGGGIYSNGDLTVVNSTISGNASTSPGSGDGGGIYVDDDLDASVEIRSSTIVDNSVENNGGGVYLAQPSSITGTIIAGNDAIDPGNDVWFRGSTPVSVAFSLIEDPSPESISSSTNLFGIDPNLKPLANNGGPTDTHAFRKSPVKNKVPKSESEKKDQRGAKRKGKGDIGAYELVKCEGVIVNRVGTGKNDKLKGTKKKDGILGLGGNDKLSGKKGKDGLCGGKGKDKLKGGPGVDKLDGGPGKDKEIQ